MYRQPSTTRWNSTPKLAGQSPESISQEAITMEYLPGLPQNTKPLRSFSGNRVKMLLKSHLGIKCYSQYNKVIRLLQHSSANSWCMWLGIHCALPGDYHSLSLICMEFHPSKVMPLTNLDEVTAQGLWHCNSSATGWHNSNQGRVFGITDQLILQNGKKALKCTGGTTTGPKYCPAAILPRR